MKKHTCNYCHQEMEYHTEDKVAEKYVCVCTNPSCPVYALLQIAMENMPKPL